MVEGQTVKKIIVKQLFISKIFWEKLKIQNPCDLKTCLLKIILEQHAEIFVLLLPEVDDTVLPDDFEFPEDDAELIYMENNLFESFEKQPAVYLNFVPNGAKKTAVAMWELWA